jgi:NNP family nitrate/nitrite transporter-like MFS transporter
MTIIDAEPAAPGLPTAIHPPRRRFGARWIDDWRPEDETFWAGEGHQVARRNLLFSILSEHIGFSVWSLWSVFVLFLGPQYGLDPAQKFLLTTTSGAVGAAMRIPYTFAVARFGGRNWTVASAVLLLVPCIYTAIILEPGVSFGTLLLAAALGGVGGGNFSSSMANIDSFYPARLKGWALGLNAGGGNLGVAVVQLVGLAVLATAGRDHPRVLLGVYLPLVVVASVGAAWFMDNLACAANDKRAMRDVAREPHTWSMSFLYVGTFGSFIGFSFAFGQVLQVQFSDTFDTPLKAAYLTFLGPLIGSLIRPVGGRLADRFGGTRVSITNFVLMGIGAAGALVASRAGSLGLFLAAFIALFTLSGLGNGSTYKMIPAIFAGKARRQIAAGRPQPAAEADARRLSRALIGVAGATGAFGGVLVNLALRESFLRNGSGDAAYIGFIAYYAACVVLAWLVYQRPASRRTSPV